MAAALAIAALWGVTMSARAEGAAAAARYSLQKVTSGYLRLDRKTGQVSHCREQRAGWVCRLVADDRNALLREIDRLRKKNAGLRADKSTARSAPPAAPRTGRSERPKRERPKTENRNTAAPKPPVSDDGKQIATLFQRMVHRFVAFARKLRRDLEGTG